MSSASKGLQPNPDLIEYLEEKLALAKEGKIISMVNIMLEKEDDEAPVLPRFPAIFVRSAEDVATLKMVYDSMIADELNRTWLVQMGYIGVDDE